MTPLATILIGEDDLDFRSYLELAVRSQGYQAQSAADGEEVLSLIRSGRQFDAVLLDIIMPERDGLDTLQEIRRFQPDMPVLMISGAATASNVVRAMKSGATDFLEKASSHEDIEKALRKVLGAVPVRKEAPAEVAADNSFYGFESWAKHLRATIQKVATSDLPVLIRGETGTGKEILARSIHAQSPRADKPFVKLNCAAIPSELLESELFGFERGAFTGAFQRRMGLFEAAEGGTLLLDEIGDMDVRLQAKLLQVAQDSEFRRLGGKESVRTDVRIFAATHRDLEQAILDGQFRSDLYFRLNVFSITLPPLRERMDDLAGLAAHLIYGHSQSTKLAAELLTDKLLAAMRAYSWPGNVRELENFVRKLIVLGDADSAAQELRGRPGVPPTLRSEPLATAPDAVSALERASIEKQGAERQAILAALEASRWSRKQAATALAIDYKALLYKMKKLGISAT